MAEGYKVMAEENRKFAEMASLIAHEVLPDWVCKPGLRHDSTAKRKMSLPKAKK